MNGGCPAAIYAFSAMLAEHGIGSNGVDFQPHAVEHRWAATDSLTGGSLEYPNRSAPSTEERLVQSA